MKKIRSQKGFTLIELMVVVLIIAIMGAIGLVSFTQANRSARNGRRQADIESVRQALLLFRQESATNCFPAASGTAYDATSTTAYAGLSSSLVSTYMPVLPDDPGANDYQYVRVAGTNGCPTRVGLRATLEPSGNYTISFP